MTLFYLLGILIALLLIVLTVEFTPVVSKTRTAKFLSEAFDTNQETPLPAWRQAISPLEKPVSKHAPQRLLRSTRSNLYWAQMGGKWENWDAVQFTAFRFAAAAAGFVLGLVVFGELMFGLAAGFLGWQFPAMSLGNVARKIRRQFQAQLPEYIQLVSAQMAAGVSMSEALQRTARAEGLVSLWMKKVLRMSQGRSILNQMQQEAERSLLPELISMTTQLEFIRRGTAQQKLLGQLATRIAADYIAGAEQRAEKVGAELVIPMVVFYFLPFLLTLMVIIGWPIVQGLL